MDPQKSLIFVFLSNSDSESFSSVTEVVLAIPAMVEGINCAERKRRRPKEIDDKGKSINFPKRKRGRPRINDDKGMGINFPKRKRGRPRKNDDRGMLIEQPSKSTKISLGNIKGDMLMSLGRGDSLGGGECFGGADFKRHTFIINTGEDIIERIKSFTNNGSRGIIVLSANGEVANVKIQPLGSNRNVLTFKDAYKIISLSCTNTVVVTEDGGVKNETGGWQITICGADKCVLIGGSLAYGLEAASTINVTIGSFNPLITNQQLETTRSTLRPEIDLNQLPLDFIDDS